MATDNPLKLLLSHWDTKRVAKRFGVTPATVSRWRSKGLPAARRKEVTATAKRVDRALQRALLNDDWAREVLSRWVEAGNAESEAMNKLRELKVRKRNSRLEIAYIQTWEGLLAEARDDRRALGSVLNSRRFRNTPTGREVGDVKLEIDRYAKAYRQAVDHGSARDISLAWKAWERQVARLLENLEELQIPGMSKRQVYTLFFSP